MRMHKSAYDEPKVRPDDFAIHKRAKGNRRSEIQPRTPTAEGPMISSVRSFAKLKNIDPFALSMLASSPLLPVSQSEEL